MTEYSIPQQGIAVGDAARAPYDADEWSLDYSASLTGFGSRANYGVLRGLFVPSAVRLFSLDVIAVGGAVVEMQPGSGLVRGTVYVNDAPLSLTVQANVSGNPRIDTVIIRKDYTAQTIRALILQGTPAVSPVPATLTQSAAQWEIPLADIAVANGFGSIVRADISPRHEFVNVGDGTYIDGIDNNSGITLEDGDIVVWDNSTSARAVTTTTTLNSHRVAGVWRGRTADGVRGRMQVRGIGRVNVRNSIAAPTSIGAFIIADSVATQARVLSNIAADTKIGFFAIGRMLEAVPSSTTRLLNCYIDVKAPQGEDYILLQEFTSSGVSAGGFTSGADRTRLVNSIAVDTTGQVTLVANQFTLSAGRYKYRASAPAVNVGMHRVVLHNITAGAALAYGTSENSANSGRSELVGLLVLSASATFELRHRCGVTNGTDGRGQAAGFGGNEIYSQIEFWRINDRD